MSTRSRFFGLFLTSSQSSSISSSSTAYRSCAELNGGYRKFADSHSRTTASVATEIFISPPWVRLTRARQAHLPLRVRVETAPAPPTPSCQSADARRYLSCRALESDGGGYRPGRQTSCAPNVAAVQDCAVRFLRMRPWRFQPERQGNNSDHLEPRAS